VSGLADLSPEARRCLVEMARRAIAERVSGWPAPDPDEPPLEELRRCAGAFVTLTRRKDGQLRGCVGLPEAKLPLGQVVARVAVAAALHDSRFPPVTAVELDDLHVHVSVLGPIEPIAAVDVVIGVHGLVVRADGRSGLLLPQVPVEHEWTREQFLEATCRKAGLPAGRWREPECELYAFTAVVFGE
jgi:AmmeMemoRadiSam system protein A